MKTMILDTHGRNFYSKIIDMITKYKIKRVDQSDLSTINFMCAVVNFINILPTAFASICFRQKVKL